MNYRTILVVGALVLLACGGDKTQTVADTSDVSEFRSMADSLAQEMASELAATQTRTGTLTVGDTTSDWTARMRDSLPVIIEERVRVGNNVAMARVFFFDEVGAIEQISEQRTESTGNSPRTTETIIEAQAGNVSARRTVNGDTTTVPDADITRLRQRAATLMEAVRRR